MQVKDIKNYAESLHDELVEIRRGLHRHPEVGLDLDITVAFVMDRLTEYGYKPERCGKSGVTALVGETKGSTFLLRADMDALPVKEETDLEFKSKNEYMHACGHDMHTTMLLGAAKLLKAYEAELCGQVKLMFQPGEEILLGAMDMIEAGVLENPKVSAGMMMHVTPAMPYQVGSALIGASGPVMAASDWVEIQVKGVGGHGSAPEDTVDPISVAAHIVIALQQISAREVAAAETFVLTFGELIAGSSGASNIIPGTAVLKGTLRTFKPEVREFVKSRIIDISESIAKAFRAEATVIYPQGCSVNSNDAGLVELANRTLPDVLGASRVIDLSDDSPAMGSEDFGEISQRVPTVTINICAVNSDESEYYPLHNSKVRFNEKVMTDGVKILSQMALSWLAENKR